MAIVMKNGLLDCTPSSMKSSDFLASRSVAYPLILFGASLFLWKMGVRYLYVPTDHLDESDGLASQ